MKKIILLMIAIFSIAMVSCNNTKVLEENTKENKISDKYKITERNIENTERDKSFMPLFYDSDIIYGTMSPKNSGAPEEFQIPYYIDSSGAFKRVEEGKFDKDEIGFIKDTYGCIDSGVYMLNSNRLSERKFYYIDIVNKNKFELDGYEKIYNSIELKLKNFGNRGAKLEGNENYYIQGYFNVEDKGKSINNEEIIIIDLKNESYYVVRNNNNRYIKFYFDNNEEAIMAIDNLGKIYKLTLQEKEIVSELYKDIGVEDLEIYDKYGYLGSFYFEDNLILNTHNNESKEFYDYSNLFYKVKSDELISMDKEKIIIGKVNNTNFFIVLYNENRYLAEISDDGEINLIYKLDDSEGYRYFYGVANKEGHNIFVTKIKYNEENVKDYNASVIKEDIKYSIIEITKNED